MKIKENDLYNDIYNEISSAFGIETAEGIFRMYRGQQITFPMHLYNVKKLRKRLMDEFDGTNLKELAVKYDYSEKTLRRILKTQEEETNTE